jgi:hypothetical protein
MSFDKISADQPVQTVEAARDLAPIRSRRLSVAPIMDWM